MDLNRQTPQRLQKTLQFFVSRLNEDLNDSLKMRYLLNLYEDFYRKRYLSDLGKDVVLKELITYKSQVKNFRDQQIFQILIFYLNDCNMKDIPEKINPIIKYQFSESYNIYLAEKGIFVSDESFTVEAQ